MTNDEKTVHILGIEFERMTEPDLNDLVARMIAEGRKIRIGNHNLHSAYLCRADGALAATFRQAEYTHCDGMSLIAWARLMGYQVGREHRVTYVDWIPALCRSAARLGWRVFYLGGREASGRQGVATLRQQYPGLDIGFHQGYFDMTPGSDENDRVLEIISEARPNLLLVGMGMPRQEVWLAENFAQVDANVMLMTGACLDYLAGTIPTPPRWSGRVGLEWLFRLGAEPRRLARRYLIEPWRLTPLLWRDVARRLGRRGGSGAASPNGS